MSNSNSQIDGLGSFNQSALNAGTIKYGAFLNASRNLGVVALSATFGNTSQNLGTIGDILPIITASIVQSNSANWDAAYTAVLSNSAIWLLSGGSGGSGGVYDDTTIRSNSANWDAAYTAVISNSAIWMLSGASEQLVGDVVNAVINTDNFVLTTDPRLSDIQIGINAYNLLSSISSDTSNSDSWDAVTSFIQANSASLVFDNDPRLTEVPTVSVAYSYLQSNSGDFILEGDSRLTDSRTPVAHNHDASSITSGKLDPARLPVIPSQEQVLISGVMYTADSMYYAGADHFTYNLSSINQGTIVTTNDGYRWVYTGDGDKRYDTSYVLLADITPDWSVISNKPSTFPIETHTHSISSINSLQSSLNTLQTNIDAKQNSGDYVLNSDSRFTVLATNSAQWGESTVQGYNAYTYVNANSSSFVFTSDSRLTDARTPISHTHTMSEISGLESALDDKASSSDLASKTSLSTFNILNTLVEENSATWEGVGTVYNYVRTTSAASVYSDDVRLARANTSYNYLTATSASLVTTSVLNSSISGKVDTTDSRLTNGATAYTYVNTNSANIVMTSDSRLSNSSTAYSYVTANSANIVMTSDSRLTSGTNAYSYVTTNSANIVMTSDTRLARANTSFTTITANSASWSVGGSGSINYTIDGGGSAITTGSKGFVQIPTNFVVQEWNIIADLLTTSFTVDVRKASYANLPTTSTITNSDNLVLTNQQKNRNSSVSWTNISAGDFVEFYVTDASNASMINISLKGIRS